MQEEATAARRGESAADPAPGAAFLATLVGLCFIMNTIARGATETFAVFLLPVEQAFGTSRSETTLTYAIYMLVHGFAAPFAGQLIDRLGARITYGLGLSLMGLGYYLAGMTTSILQYYAAAGVMPGLGASCLGMVVATSLMSRWFSKRLGSMMALPYAAVGAGVLVIPLVTQMLLQSVSWGEAHRYLGVGILSLLPLVVVLPLGRMTQGAPEWRAQRQAAAARGAPLWPLSRAVRTGAFWAMFGVYFWTSVAAYAVLPQSVAFLVEQGFDRVWAASAFGMTGALSVVGILAIGWISDRIGKLGAVTLSYISSLTGILSLVAIFWRPEMVLVYTFVVFFGLMQGARGPIIAAVVATIFRGGAVGAIFGTLSLAMGLGAALGSWGSGLLHDLTGNYLVSFAMAAAASFAGLLTYWSSPSLRNEQRHG
ncbi:MAG: MFS transporter [Hyphomicrobiaceae bacterium]